VLAGFFLYDDARSAQPTIVDLLGMSEAAFVPFLEDDPMPTDSDTAHQLHAALNAAGARGSVRVLDSGQWVVRLMRGQSSQGYGYPPADQEEREQWLAVMADQLEAAAGVRPDFEAED
jgi:hypothetical protein